MVKIYADGGCLRQGTPNAEAYGSVRVIGKTDTTLRYQFPDAHTNNAAEYEALLKALGVIDLATKNTTWQGEITIHMDSDLVINQVLGSWKCRASHLVPYRDNARAYLAELLSSGIDIKLQWLGNDKIKEMLGH